MKLFARLRNDSPRAPVARTACASPPARHDGAPGGPRSAAWIAARIWLPEPLEDRIAELAKYRRSSRSALIREALFICVYGACRFEQMQEQRQGFFGRKAIPEFCSTNVVRAFEKSIDNFKVWLPRNLKADLTALAHAAGMTCSSYVRAILILHFMGRQLTPEREAALQAASEQPEDG